MNPNDRDRLVGRLIEVEGARRHVYTDSHGLLTIGIGRLCDPAVPSSGLTLDEQVFLCRNDLRRAEGDLAAVFPWFPTLDPVRQLVLIELAFNMGIGNTKRGLRSFRNTLPAIASGQWQRACDGLRRSKWYSDVGPRRADPLLAAMLTGELSPEWGK